MYCEFYGFSEKPFELAPDSNFLYVSPNHQEAISTLVSGIEERSGLVILVGEEGTGKTMLLLEAMDQLSGNTMVLHIENGTVTCDYLLAMVLVELGLAKPEEDLSRTEALNRFRDFDMRHLTKVGTVVFVIEEAQNLDTEVMSVLRFLSDLEVNDQKPIQVVLSGRPDLEPRLNEPVFREFANDINLKLHINPLEEEETYKYISHRLTIANYSGPDLFDGKALRLIWQYSGGVPRKINIICDKTLLIGYERGKKRTGAGMVKEAVKDLSWKPLSGRVKKPTTSSVKEREQTPEAKMKRTRFQLVLAGAVLLTAWIIVSVLFFLKGPELNPRPVESVSAPEGIGVEVGTQPESAEGTAFFRGKVDGGVDREPKVASVVEESLEPEVPMTEEEPSEGEAPAEDLPVGEMEEFRTDLESLVQEGDEIPIEQEKPALTVEVEEPVASTESSSIPEKTDEKPATLSALPPVSGPPKTGKLIIQLGAFRERSIAEDLKERLKEAGYDAYLEEAEVKDKGFFYRLRVRCCSSRAEANALRTQLKKQGFGDSFIVGKKKN